MKFSKSVLTIMLAASLAVSASSYSESCIAYAIENAALQTDFSEAETLKITDDTVLKLPVGQTLTYSTITVSAGKTLTVKGGGSLVADKITGGNLLICEGSVFVNSISSINKFEISDGLIKTKSISGGAIVVSGGIVEADNIIGENGGPVLIMDGNVSVGTLKSGNGINSSESYSIFDEEYPKASGGKIQINGGTVTVNKEIVAGNSYGKYSGGQIVFQSGQITVNGNITAGNSVYRSSDIIGGSIIFGSDANIVVNGNISGGNGSDGVSNYLSDSPREPAMGTNGGDVIIYSGEINGTIYGGKGGNSGCRNNYATGVGIGGKGGTVKIYGGKINGDIISGHGGNGAKVPTGYGGIRAGYGGDSGDIIINNGVVYAPNKISVDAVGIGGYFTESTAVTAPSGKKGKFYSEPDGSAKIICDNFPTPEADFSGIIITGENINAYGTPTLSSNEYLSKGHTLTVKKNGKLTVSGCTLKADGEINNGGSIIIGADGQLDGSGTYIYNNETTAIPELRAKLAKEMITIPEGMVYSGADQKTRITMEPKEAYGITFENMSLSDANITFTYSETSDGEQNKTDIIKDAGYYSAFINGSSDGIPFEVSRKEISVGAVNALEDKSGITGMTFEGLAGDETLEYGKDYTVSGIEWGENSVSGVITLLDTPAAKNYSVSENGSFNCDNVNYEHVHNMVWKYDGEQHWKECLCGEKTDVGAHTRNDGVTKQEPSETTDEIIVYSCTECGYVMEEQTIHNFVGDWESDENGHWQVCRCGERSEVYPHGNDDAYEGVITSEPTEENDGVRTFYCKECGYAYRTEPVKYEHVHAAYGEWLSDETYHWHGCKCGEEGVIFDKEEHTPDSGTIIKEANETENGVIRYYCSVCGAQMNDEEISVTVIGAVVSSDRVIATYKDTVGSEPYTVEYAFGDVPEKLAEYMYSTDIQLVIDFVNNFSTAESGDHMILTPAQMKSVEYVIGYDNLY